MRSRPARFSLVPLCLTIALLEGCVLDPVSIITEPIMHAAYAAGPSDTELQAEADDITRSSLLKMHRDQSCQQLTLLWPEIRDDLLQKASERLSKISLETTEQVIAEKGCAVDYFVTRPDSRAPANPWTAMSTDQVLKASYVAFYQQKSCDVFASHWPHLREGILQNEDPRKAKLSLEAAEQVISEKGCQIDYYMTRQKNGAVLPDTASAAPSSTPNIPASAPMPAVAKPPHIQPITAQGPKTKAFCYIALDTSENKRNPNVRTSIFHDPAASATRDSMIATLQNYRNHVLQQQPGVWLDFSISLCGTVGGTCLGTARKTFGPQQSAMLSCFETQALAEKTYEFHRKTSPNFTLIER